MKRIMASLYTRSLSSRRQFKNTGVTVRDMLKEIHMSSDNLLITS